MTGAGDDERRPARGGVNVVRNSSNRNDSGPDRQSASCRTFHADRGPRFTSWCSGSPTVGPLLRRAGVPTVFDRRRQAWAIPTNRLDDVLVYAEHVDGRFVTVEAVAS